MAAEVTRLMVRAGMTPEVARARTVLIIGNPELRPRIRRRAAERKLTRKFYQVSLVGSRLY